MPAAIAWVISLPGDVRVAVGTMEFVHILPDSPGRMRLTEAPPFLNEAISWDHGMVPVFDAGKFSEGIEKTADSVYFGIVRYRPQPSNPQRFGALKMSGIPKRFPVDDERACDLPESLGRWRQFSVSCFTLDGRPVPVLDLAKIFSHAPSDSAVRAAVGAASGDTNARPGPEGPEANGYTDSLAAT